MARQPRIQWQVLDVSDVETMWTPGWLPDSSNLRWSLANSLRVEGVREGWFSAFTQSEAIELREGYVAEDEEGNFVEVTPEGVVEATGDVIDEYRPATFARLEIVSQD